MTAFVAVLAVPVLVPVPAHGQVPGPVHVTAEVAVVVNHCTCARCAFVMRLHVGCAVACLVL